METSTESPVTSSPVTARWIVGVDGSERSHHAARWAVAQARGRVGSVELATAWAIPTAPALPPVGSMKPYWDIDAFEASAQKSVDELASEFSDESDLTVSTSVGRGHASSVLLDAARHADLLVVGTRGRGGFARLIMGSTSTQCATHSSVPIAVVPRAASTEAARHILVAVDGSQNSLDALRWAIEFALPDTQVECVFVWDSTPIVAGTDVYIVPEGADLARAGFDESVDSIVAELAPATKDVTVSTRFLEGHPRQVLAEVAEGADLLVMGARGRGAIGAAILGSVSTWLLHHVERTMVVVPHASAEGAATRQSDASRHE